ncbi:unnamed protein product [Vicia faba]|uniref:Uncharacterized protein n=1 Tax=Vicia faba TaxID=3906 RepID=A0AAV1B377_VICFA|nr:unnamed protein product [Vicia faba]
MEEKDEADTNIAEGLCDDCRPAAVSRILGRLVTQNTTTNGLVYVETRLEKMNSVGTVFYCYFWTAEYLKIGLVYVETRLEKWAALGCYWSKK